MGNLKVSLNLSNNLEPGIEVEDTAKFLAYCAICYSYATKESFRGVAYE